MFKVYQGLTSGVVPNFDLTAMWANSKRSKLCGRKFDGGRKVVGMVKLERGAEKAEILELR
jgi:hypothetical protein